MKGRVILGIGLMLAAIVPVVSAQMHQGRRIVEARLVADVAAVQPGRAFTVGLHFQIEPGWHIYWENSGDAGLPIRVAWTLPEGFGVSPLRWPTPRRYTESGGMTAFGYQDEAMVLATVTPPASLSGESVVLEAAAQWLVCKEVCIPGNAKLRLTLPVGRATPSAEAELIARFERAVPQPASRSPVRVVRVEWAPQEGNRGTLRLDLGGRAVVREFFPRRVKGATIQHGGVRVSGRSILIPMELEARGRIGDAVSGVVVTDQGAYELRATVGSAFAPAASQRREPAEPAPIEGQMREAPGESEGVPDGSATAGTNWLSMPFRVRGQQERAPSLALILLLALLGGVILNVTPCVLPVLSIKILSFVHQAGEDRRRVRLMGMGFAAGVLVSLWALALVVIALRATGEQIGWGFQFQSPAFVVAISTVVFVFALNLLGVFELRSPSVRTRWLEKPGVVGAFFNGVLATTLATPCTAPFLGTAVGFAFAQPGPIVGLVFTAIAVGLALPYVLLSWHPQWLRFVPRPGMWMVRFKQAMGFLLLGALLWLLDVLGSQMGLEAVIWTGVFLLCVAIAVWMIGQVGPHVSARRRWGVGGAALLLVVGGYVWAFEKELRWREARALASEASAPAADGIEWKPFSLADIERRVRRGETVFIDFTAEWCWNCKVNERTVLDSEAVRRKMRQLRVTAIRADWTNRNPEITEMLRKFGRSGVPFYVIFPAGRLTEPIALPEILTPGLVIRALEEAGPSRVAGE
jgi:thiol:disulfide interchange protein DsbD